MGSMSYCKGARLLIVCASDSIIYIVCILEIRLRITYRSELGVSSRMSEKYVMENK